MLGGGLGALAPGLALARLEQGVGPVVSGSPGATVPRSLASHFGEVFDILDYGAVSDGATDCTSAIQAACVAAFKAGGGGVFIPPATPGFLVDPSRPILVGGNTTVYGVRGQSLIKAIRARLSSVTTISGIFQINSNPDGSTPGYSFMRGPGGSGAQFNVTWTLDGATGKFQYQSSTLAAAGTGYRPPNSFGAGGGDFININGPNPGEFITFQVATTTSWRGSIATYTYVASSEWTTNPTVVTQAQNSGYSIGEYDSDWVFNPPGPLADNVVFKDFVIDGNNYNPANSTGYVFQPLSAYTLGIYGKGVKDVTISGMEIRYLPASGVQLYRHRRAHIVDNYIHHCGFGAQAGADLNAVSCFGFYLTDTTFGGMKELNSRGLVIANNTFEDCHDVLISYSTHRGCLISGNVLRGAFGIEGQATSFQVADTVALTGIEVPNDQIIVGNYLDGLRADGFSSVPIGTGVAPQAGNEGRCVIANNTIRNFNSYGIQCTNLNNYRVQIVGNQLENCCANQPSLQAVFVDAAECEFIGNSVKTQATGTGCLLVQSRCRNAKVLGNTFDTISTTAAVTINITDTTPGNTLAILVSENLFTEVNKNALLVLASSPSAPVSIDVLEFSYNLCRNCNRSGSGGNQEFFCGTVNGATMTVDTFFLDGNHVWQSPGALHLTTSPFAINNVLNSGTSCSLLSLKDNVFCRGFTYPIQMPSYTPLTVVLDGNSYDGTRTTDLPLNGSLPLQGHFTKGDRLRVQNPGLTTDPSYYECIATGAVTSVGYGSNTAYTLTTNGAPTTVNPSGASGFVFQCTVAGTTGGSQPSWNTTIGSTTVDGTVTWTCIDTAAHFGAVRMS